MQSYNDWKVDLNRSQKALLSISDTILPKFFTGKIHSIESSDNEILLLLDTKSGIDYINEDIKGLRGISARVQFNHLPYRTFTIRLQRHTGAITEYQKRVDAIKYGYFYPFFYLHAYFDEKENPELQSIAVVKTIDLFNFIENNKLKIETRFSDNEFYIIRWNDLKNKIPMMIYEENTLYDLREI